MREDEALSGLSSEQRWLGLSADIWKLAWPLGEEVDVETAYSTSGNEPNSLFYNLRGEGFVDLSMVSGLDFREDGRGLARLDIDRDGFVDLAITNANAPRLQLVRNRIGETPAGRRHRFLAVRLVGGHDAASPNGSWSSRDACGARIEVTADGRQRVLEHRCGEGFATQNSSTLIVGLGAVKAVDELRVMWPSGKITELGSGDLPAVNSLVTLFERPSPQHPTGVHVTSY